MSNKKPNKKKFSDGKINGTFSELLEIISILRKECPWDREQKVDDIKFKLVEEAYEAIDKFDKSDFDGFASELGDIILVALFIIKIMEEEGKFDLRYVLKKLMTKLVERHPHVFGNKKLETAKDVLQNWEKMKGKIKKEDFNLSMPSLYLIYRIVEKIKNKFGENIKLPVELPESDSKDIPDTIFKYSLLCAMQGINPEEVLRKKAIEFIEKIEKLEK